MDPPLLLERYRRDRRDLLELLLSAGLVRAPTGSSVDLAAVDLDAISADYVLECIASGGEFDPSDATRRYFDALKYPIMVNSPPETSYFCLSRAELSGSPPQREAPSIEVRIVTQQTSLSTREADDLVSLYGTEAGINSIASTDKASQAMKYADTGSLDLPRFNTGLSDDDMRETAYEVLIASLFSWGQVHFFDGEKEKGPRLLNRLPTHGEVLGTYSASENGSSDLLNLVRGQMEISERMDLFIKQGLELFRSPAVLGPIDVAQISSELLHAICRLEFPIERLRMQWLRRQANVVEELLFASDNVDPTIRGQLDLLLSKLRSTEEWAVDVPVGYMELLTPIGGHVSELSRMPGKFGLPGENIYWTSSYHFNIKLYEKLLCSVFDVLEDGQILEEADEILGIVKLTWQILGITQKLHDALYAWVLFQRFIQTGEVLLLTHTVREMQKVVSNNNVEAIEETYIKSLICSLESCGSKRFLNLVDTILFKMNSWCRSQLEDYHLHFSQDKYAMFESAVALAEVSRISSVEECEEINVIGSITVEVAESEFFHVLVVKSIQAAYKRALSPSDSQCNIELKHPLMMLAKELKLVADTEFTLFSPVLCRHYAEAGRLAFILLHLLYGEHLKPFLEGLTHLSEDVKGVLAASNKLELHLAHKICSMLRDNVNSSVISYLHPYKIGQFSAPHVLQWINVQHEKLLEWTIRAIALEDWGPLSSQHKQAASAVEVFRIIEETVDQFFNSNLPVDNIQLRSLLICVSHGLEAYIQHMINQQVAKASLYPSPPVLTRYTETLKPFARKKLVERSSIEQKIAITLESLTVTKLCVKLNTLHYIRDQLDSIEDAIKQSWSLVQSDLSVLDYLRCLASGQSFVPSKENLSTSSTSIDELFMVFDDVRRSAVAASELICDFIGAKVIFWDLRDSFLFSLYHGSVEGARLATFIPELDHVLNLICDLIVDALRDQVILRICQESMDGYIWVLLDGGPSRVFSETDVELMQEDLVMLKDLFVADDQGLPSDVVKQEARLAHQIVGLYALKADTIIEMLINASEQISCHLEPKVHGRCVNDAQTLLRILCHKKEKSASEFLRVHYHLPRSSDYEENAGKGFSEIFKRNASFDWGKAGQRSFWTMKQKFQNAKS